jgi:hypothetical protein
MKRFMGAGLAAALILAGAPASAQLSKYVIQGAPAKKIQQKNEISLATAKAIAAGCAAYAQKNNASAAIAIIDMFGQEV